MKTQLLLHRLTIAIMVVWMVAGNPGARAAPSNCVQTYTVVRGDTLGKIAVRLGTTARALAQLNNIANQNLIFVNQVLCVSTAPSTPTPVPVVATQNNARVAVEANFGSISGDAVSAWKLDPRAGTRIVFPLKPGRAGVETVAGLGDILQAVDAGRPITLWVHRAPGEQTYTLVSIGTADPLSGLRLYQQQPDQPLVPAGQKRCIADQSLTADVLGAPGAGIESLTIWLEAPIGPRYPLAISCIGHEDDATTASQRYAEPIMALIPDVQGMYIARMVLNNPVIGPPGLDVEQFCADTAGNDNWPYPWMRATVGC